MRSVLLGTALTITLVLVNLSFLIALFRIARKEGLLFPETFRESPTPHQFWVQQHLRWHDARQGKRRIIFQTIGAGLGDHVRALANAYSYAVLTRRRLQIDWERPYPVADVLSARAKRRFIRRDSSRKKYRAKWRFSYNQQLPQHIRQLLAGDEETVVLKMGPGPKGIDISDDLIANRWKNVYIPPFDVRTTRDVVRVIMEPSKELLKIVRSITKKLRLPKRYIAVHARLGSGTNETHFERFAVIQGKEMDFAKCYAQAVKMFAWNRKPVVFVASDTPTWRPVFGRAMRKVMPHSRVVFLENEVKHWRSISENSEHGHTNFMLQHAEAIVIGNAERSISIRSGFPRIGFLRGLGRHFTVLNVGQCKKGRVLVHTSEDMNNIGKL